MRFAANHRFPVRINAIEILLVQLGKARGITFTGLDLRLFSLPARQQFSITSSVLHGKVMVNVKHFCIRIALGIPLPVRGFAGHCTNATPLLGEGGVAAPLIKYREASLAGADGVVRSTTDYSVV